MSVTPEQPRRLILVKHSLPTVEPATPAAQWTLSPEGRRRCAAFVARLRPYAPAAIAASDEPKATETAHLLATGLGHAAPLAIDRDLREHERSAADFFAAEADFHAAVRELFARPRDLVFGRETAHAARTRFAAAIDRLLVAAQHGNLIVVTHGTVISLFAEDRAGLAPFRLWRSLQLPSYVALTLPTFRWLETVAEC